MEIAYPNLRAEIARRGIKKTAMARCIGVTDRAFYNKLSGISTFTWPEACKIRDQFFPDMEKDVLFADAQRPGEGAE